MKQKSYYGLIWAFITGKKLTVNEKAELIGLLRAYLAIPAFWAIYLGRGYI